MSAFNPFKRSVRSKTRRQTARARKIAKQQWEAQRKTYPTPKSGLGPTISAFWHRDAKANVRRLKKRMAAEGQRPVYATESADPKTDHGVGHDWTVAELRSLAKAKGIKGYSKMNRTALLEVLR